MGNDNRRKKPEPRRETAPPGRRATKSEDPDNLFTGWKWGEERLGEALAIGGLIGFLFVCMILPLVGKAGARVSWAGKNRLAFAAAVTGTLLLAALASASKWKQMKEGRGGAPKGSLALAGVCVLLLVALAAGLLAL